MCYTFLLRGVRGVRGVRGAEHHSDQVEKTAGRPGTHSGIVGVGAACLEFSREFNTGSGET